MGWNQRIAGGNGFDAVRLALASLVIFEHSFFLLDNSAAHEPLYRLTGGQVNSGALAVYLFFALSGFLVTRSRTLSSLGRYSLKRVLRIVPGFVVASLIGVLVVGPLAAAPGYFGAQNWPRVLATILSLKQVSVAGAFVGQPLQLVHGTLWSIRYEFDCYILIALLGGLGLLSGRRAIVAFSLIALALAAGFLWPPPVIDHGLGYFLISSPDSWSRLFSFFFAGSALYIWREKIPKSPWLLAASLCWIAVSAVVGGLYWALVLGGTYAILYAALSFEFEPRFAGRRGDLSYGLYLYGWPVQQLLLHMNRDIAPLVLFGEAMLVTALAAWLSWTLVEAPALRLAERRRARPAGPAKLAPDPAPG